MDGTAQKEAVGKSHLERMSKRHGLTSTMAFPVQLQPPPDPIVESSAGDELEHLRAWAPRTVSQC